MNKLNVFKIISDNKLGFELLTNKKDDKPTGPDLKAEELMTDYGNGQRFAHQHRGKVFYAHEEGAWYIWNGVIWQKDGNDQAMRLAHDTARAITTEAEKLPKHEDRKQLKEWATYSLGAPRIKAMLESAKSYMTRKLDELDTHTYLLNVNNGTVDLKTGTLMPHDRVNLITKLAPVAYNTEAQCPQWLSFLNVIFDGKEELITYVQKVLGYSLTGDMSEKCFFIMYGPEGNNGKTVMMNTVMAIMKDYAVQNPTDTLLKRKPGAQTNDLVRIKNARMVLAAEASESYSFDEPLVKRLTGDDPITARLLYKEHVTFKPECKIVLATNSIPRFKGDDKAFANRIKIIPFMVSIPTERQDTQLKEKLLAEQEGILNWLIQGCLLWQSERLGNIPGSITPEYEDTTLDAVKAFIAYRCIVDPGSTETTKVLHDSFTTYAATSCPEIEVPAISTFGSLMTQLGYKSEHGKQGNYRIGIRIKPLAE